MELPFKIFVQLVQWPLQLTSLNLTPQLVTDSLPLLSQLFDPEFLHFKLLNSRTGLLQFVWERLRQPLLFPQGQSL